MSIIDTQIIEEAVQHDGRRRYRYRYTHSEGKVTEFDRNLTPVGFDAVTDAAAKIPEIEAQEKDAELLRIYNAVIGGKDYATERDEAIFNTVDELESFILKRTGNLRTSTNQKIQENVHKIIAFQLVFEASASRIGGLMGIPTGEAQGFKGDVNVLMIAVQGYTPTVGPFPEVE